METQIQILHVRDFLTIVNDLLVQSLPSNRYGIEGEISDYRVSQGKWVYFDLKDETGAAVLKCFMTLWQVKLPLANGMRVRVNGYPKIYERFGTLSFTVQSVALVGEGTLKQAYDRLKKQLEQEGLFDASRKRGLPRFPRAIGLITSRDAAAYGDFLRILTNRWRGTEVRFFHIHVQGEEAVGDIERAFRYFNHLPVSEQPDVLVLTRGGGSLEDLHAFNDERSVRAVFQSRIPVVCGVGHERDESLCDFVADVRASTPSNAAERVVPDTVAVLHEVDAMHTHMQRRLRDRLQSYRLLIERATRVVDVVLERTATRLDHCVQRLQMGMKKRYEYFVRSVDAHERVIKSVDPTRVLARGYAIVRTQERVVTSVKDVRPALPLSVQLKDGTFDAEVRRVDGFNSQPSLF